jgi:EAL domain-containing protein (putative c-di-GMP-specific phosphodiesterase class I)
VLLDMGCNSFQGYLLSAPVATETLEGIFERSGRANHIQLANAG